MNDWDDVRFFLEVARCGSVTQASRALGVNHSTVSRRVRALEERYGVRLFERVPGGFVLSEQAADMLELAHDIEDRHHAFERTLKGQDARLFGSVALTMPHDLFEFFFAAQLASFYQAYPDISLDISVAKGLRNLSAREADIAVRITNQPPEYLVGKKITPIRHALFAHPAVLDHDVTPVITWNTEGSLPDWASSAFSTAKVVMRVDDLLSMYQAVASGIGVARMPVFMHNLADAENVAAISAASDSDWGVWVLSHVDLRGTARVQACRRFVVNTLEQHKTLFTEIS